jgi:hypothetical protein
VVAVSLVLIRYARATVAKSAKCVAGTKI